MKSNERKMNIVIGVLMGIIMIMSIGYAVFATQLNINGVSNIHSVWAIGFVNSDTEAYEITTGEIESIYGTRHLGIKPIASVVYGNNVMVDGSLSMDAHISAKLNQPGDEVKFILPIKNTGTLDAILSSPILTVDSGNLKGNNDYVSNSGNIEIYVEDFEVDNIVRAGGSSSLVVVMKYLGNDVTESNGEEINCFVAFNATQAN